VTTPVTDTNLPTSDVVNSLSLHPHKIDNRLCDIMLKITMFTYFFTNIQVKILSEQTKKEIQVK